MRRTWLAESTLVEIALLATILVPTEAALAKAVVNDASVRNRLRTGLNFESGPSDGICVPIFLALLGSATNGQEERGVADIRHH